MLSVGVDTGSAGGCGAVEINAVQLPRSEISQILVWTKLRVADPPPDAH
jgi:hypothetical protein